MWVRRIITTLNRYIRTRRRNITRGSLSELSGGRDVDLCSRYVWNSCTRRSLSQFSGSSDLDLCSRYVLTSRTRRSLS